MARRGQSLDLWQSHADLAMGLMALLTLILLMLLAVQNNTNAELEVARSKSETELEAVRQERSLLELERKGFALELMGLFEVTYGQVAEQDAAETWISGLFEEEDCRLALGPSGNLEILDRERRRRAAANLYESGATALSEEGRSAIESCRKSFLRLAYCLSPLEDAPVASDERRRRQLACLGRQDPNPEAVARLREGVEALVLEGSTDRYPYGATPGIVGAQGARRLGPLGSSFLGNAYLGAERARQALGYLVALVQDQNADPYDALEVILSRVSVESPSFGRYQVGPREWRFPGCGEDDACAAARNLSLRIRWRKAELRRPLETIRERACRLIQDSGSALARGLESAQVDRHALAQRLGCSMGEKE